MGCGEFCGGCPLEKIGSGFTQVEVGSRYTQTGLLLVGEASGEAESRDSLPFRPYAQSGSLLADAMREVGISRADVAITNLWRCRPPKDWFEGPWQYGATQHCLTNYLSPAIQELKPKAILTLGGQAFRALTEPIRGKSGTLDYIRGYALKGAGAAEGIPVIPTYHPAFLRRGASHLTPLLQRDLRRSLMIATGRLAYIPDPHAYPNRFLTYPTIDEAWEWFRQIDPAKAIYSDLETPRSRREDEDERTSFSDRDIIMAQFSQGRNEGIALPWRDEFIEVAKTILATPNRKVGHNWFGFDLEVLAANGVEVGGDQDDTMLQFHFYHPDLPANLQAVAQWCGFPVAWKHLADSDPEFYGCMDVAATAHADEVLTNLLEREGMREPYRSLNLETWPILRDMSRRGLPVSEEKRLGLKAQIEREHERVDSEIRALVPPEVLSSKQKNGLKRAPKDTNGYREIDVVIEKEEKCQCKKAERPMCPICSGSGIVPVGTVLRRWALPVEFNPNSSQQVKKYMKFKKHPVPKHQKRTDAQTGEASDTTEVKELERLYAKTKDPIYPLLIQKRQITKVDGTYCEGWKPWADGRVHSTFTFGTATLQTSSKAPNVQNGLKHAPKGSIKEKLRDAFSAMQQAEPGHLMVNFDLKSFHAQTTACEFGLPDYLRLAKIDIHSFVTCHYLKLPERHGLLERPDQEMRDLFKQLKKDDRFKYTRDYKAKRTILGIQFAMFWRKLYQLNPDDFENEREARALWELIMVDLFPGLKKGQERMKELATEQKFLQNKYGAIRRFYDVQRWDRKQQKFVGGDQAEAAVAFLPASSAFGHVRDILHRIRAHGWDDRFQLVNSIHDSLVFHCPERDVDECVALVQAEMEKPSSVLIYPGVAPNGLDVEAEASVGESLAEMKEYRRSAVTA